MPIVEIPLEREPGQERLPMSYRETHLANGDWLLGLYRQALIANDVHQSRIATETGRDPATITLMLSGKQAIAKDVLGAIVDNDALGIILAGVCQRYGWEPPRRRVEDLDRELRELRAWKARAMALLADMPGGGR